MERDREIARRGEGQRDRIARHGRPGRNADGRLAAEAQHTIRAWTNARARIPDADRGRADLEWRRSASIRELHAHGVSADARADDLSDRLVVEPSRGRQSEERGSLEAEGARAPGPHPVDWQPGGHE